MYDSKEKMKRRRVDFSILNDIRLAHNPIIYSMKLYNSSENLWAAPL